MATRRSSASDLGRVQARRAKWQAMLEEWRASGLRLAEFCRRGKLQLWQLSWWKRKFEREQGALEKIGSGSRAFAAGAQSGARFVEAVIVQSVSASSAARSQREPVLGAPVALTYEVLLLNGRRLMVPARFESSVLEQLLGVLEGRP